VLGEVLLCFQENRRELQLNVQPWIYWVVLPTLPFRYLSCKYAVRLVLKQCSKGD
jgi:hypothetical protein